MILVTGATGKVGRHVVTGLLDEGAPVRALTRGAPAAGLPADAEVARWDPGEPETLTAALAGTSAVFINVTAVGGVIAGLMAAAARRRPSPTGRWSTPPASADGSAALVAARLPAEAPAPPGSRSPVRFSRSRGAPG